MVAIDSELRRAALATLVTWAPCVGVGASFGGPVGVAIGVVGIVVTWIAVRLAARADLDRRHAIATSLWAAPCALTGVALAVLLAYESMRGRMGVIGVFLLLAAMLVAAAIGRVAGRLVLGRVAPPIPIARHRPLPRTTIFALVAVGVVAFDVLTGTTMATGCVTDGTCEVGIPVRIEGSTPARLFGFAFDLAVFLLPGVWLAALRSPAPNRRAMGRIGLVVTAALIGTALMASSPKWFGHRVWAGDRTGLVLGR